MPEYRVDIKPSARKELDALPAEALFRMIGKLEALATNPRPHGSRKLRGGLLEHRLRVGDWRAVYTVDDKKRLVTVTRVRHRSHVYD